MGTRHFECRTFDLSDNSPYISSVILAPEECKKNTQERYEIVKSEPAQSPVRRTFSADETAGASKNFESSCQNRTWRNLTEDNGRCESLDNAVFSRLSAPVRIENAVKIRVRKFPPISPSSNGFSEKPIRIFDRTERFFTPKITLLAVREKHRLCRTAPKVV